MTERHADKRSIIFRQTDHPSNLIEGLIYSREDIAGLDAGQEAAQPLRKGQTGGDLPPSGGGWGQRSLKHAG